MQLNCNSLHARKSELLKRLADQKPDVVLLQETRLLENEADPRFPGYNIAARRDTPNGRPWPGRRHRGRTRVPHSQTLAGDPQEPKGSSAGLANAADRRCATPGARDAKAARNAQHAARHRRTRLLHRHRHPRQHCQATTEDATARETLKGREE